MSLVFLGCLDLLERKIGNEQYHYCCGIYFIVIALINWMSSVTAADGTDVNYILHHESCVFLRLFTSLYDRHDKSPSQTIQTCL